MTRSPTEGGEYEEPPVIRDRRRVDPDTGEVRPGEAAAAGPEGPPPSGQPAVGAQDPSPPATEQALVEDLRRLKAEYVNYKKRVDRDRDVARSLGVAEVVERLLPVLDDIDRARQHGHLDGGFKAVADSLDGVVTRLGLQRFGEKGDAFDPSIHEALMHSHDDAVSEPTCVEILFSGYRLGERVLRPARVAVAEPAGEPEAGPAAVDVAAERDPEGGTPGVDGQGSPDPGR